MITKQLELNNYGNKDLGYLCFFESNKDIPFDFKRIYYIYNVPNDVNRGHHAHKKLKQILWCQYGSIEITLDDGKNKELHLLDAPNKALLVLEGIWHEMVWKIEKSVLCVAASDYYNENDYIRNYDEFLKYVKKGYWSNANQL